MQAPHRDGTMYLCYYAGLPPQCASVPRQAKPSAGVMDYCNSCSVNDNGVR